MTMMLRPVFRISAAFCELPLCTNAHGRPLKLFDADFSPAKSVQYRTDMFLSDFYHWKDTRSRPQCLLNLQHPAAVNLSGDTRLIQKKAHYDNPNIHFDHKS
jgi:hypothetical protein